MAAESEQIDYKTQEIKFVEWSLDANSDDYDIKKMIEDLRVLPQERISILDVGGGIGAVGQLLADQLANVDVDVIDNSVLAKQNFVSHDRVSLIFDDFLNMRENKKFDYIIFRTVLHHIIGPSSRETARLQNKSIDKAKRILADGGKIVLIENFYEPFFGNDLTGEIIFQLTKLTSLATMFRHLGANTAGEGVRFRSFRGWMRLFTENALIVSGEILKQSRPMPLWQSVPFICRDRYQAIVEFRRMSDRP